MNTTLIIKVIKCPRWRDNNLFPNSEIPEQNYSNQMPNHAGGQKTASVKAGAAQSNRTQLNSVDHSHLVIQTCCGMKQNYHILLHKETKLYMSHTPIILQICKKPQQTKINMFILLAFIAFTFLIAIMLQIKLSFSGLMHKRRQCCCYYLLTQT